MQVVHQLLDISGIGRDRMQLRWVSAAEGQIFANFVTELSKVTQDMGPFDPEQHKLQLAAVEGALDSPRLRWLVGMDRQITERGNVYNQKVDEKEYQKLIQEVAQVEYQKALILEVLRDGRQSVREIAAKSSLPVYTVSQLLSDVEKAGLVEFNGYDGSTPKFIRLAA
jgi:F420-non-reducing hydrogenase iron-sulfur subunit